MTTKALTGRQARWWETLSGYHLRITHTPGKLNPADGPSTRPDYRVDGEKTMQKQRAVALKSHSSEEPAKRLLQARGKDKSWKVAASILLASTGGRTHQVQRHTVEETAEGEEAYGRPPEDFRKVLVDLQKEDPFVREIREYVLAPGRASGS
ncbi:MAG: hypothetical protein M1816_004991 [Peltula sp. TS41687]|nr:MAG: hypothetical protein M1816_004991 [Peltula sp. TS41687]